MSHTPGPWSCDYGVLSVFCDTGAEVAACVRGNHDDGSPLTCDEMECNLNVIAAAPELLERLKSMVSGAECECDTADEEHPLCDICWSRQVIAKAEGRTDDQ